MASISAMLRGWRWNLEGSSLRSKKTPLLLGWTGPRSWPEVPPTRPSSPDLMVLRRGPNCWACSRYLLKVVAPLPGRMLPGAAG